MPNVVVIDDDQSIREMLVGALKTNGHQTFTASDGDEGLELIRRTRPDLIFLDLMMPRMSDYEVLDELQADGDLGNIPVIILTALDHRSQIVEGLQKGANDYITKPFSLQELLARASVQLRIQDLDREIRSSEAYHRALFEHAADPEIVLDKDGGILRVNEAAISLLGLAEESLLNARLHDLISVQDRPQFAVAFTGAFEGSDIPIFETHLAPSEGTAVPVDANLYPVEIEGRRQLILHLRDIRRRKAAEARSTMILEFIGDGIFITDHAGIILLSSSSVTDLTGYPADEIIGLDIARFHTKDRVRELQDPVRVEEHKALIYEDTLRRRDGQEIPVEWTVAGFSVGSEVYYIDVARNIADRKAAEDKRVETERLTALLEIAGGAAHEINQPLTAILGYAEMAQTTTEEEHPACDYLGNIVEAALRISQTIKRMQAIKEYRTRPYANGHQIVDFERSAQPEGGGDPNDS